MAARAPLHLVEPAPVTVDVPAGLLAAAIDNAGAIADDLLEGLEVARNRVWADSRAGALHELGAMAIRIEALREDFAALDPHRPTPPRPRRVA